MRNKFRLGSRIAGNRARHASGYGWMRGTAKELGDIVGPVWDGSPWDAELGIAYHGDNGPVYWVNGELSESNEK